MIQKRLPGGSAVSVYTLTQQVEPEALIATKSHMGMPHIVAIDTQPEPSNNSSLPDDKLSAFRLNTTTILESDDPSVQSKNFDYLVMNADADPTINTNNASLEAAQSAILDKFLYYSNPDALEEDGGNSLFAKLVAAQKKNEEREKFTSEVNEQDERRERRDEHRKKWDEEKHSFGGEELTGEEINQIYDWFGKKENQDKVRKKLLAQGKTQSEIDDTFRKIEERRKIWDKMRDGTASDADTRRYKELEISDVVEVEKEIRVISSGRDQQLNADGQKLGPFDRKFVLADPNNYSYSHDNLKANNTNNIQERSKDQNYFPSAPTDVDSQFNLSAQGNTTTAPLTIAQSPKPRLLGNDLS